MWLFAVAIYRFVEIIASRNIEVENDATSVSCNARERVYSFNTRWYDPPRLARLNFEAKHCIVSKNKTAI